MSNNIRQPVAAWWDTENSHGSPRAATVASMPACTAGYFSRNFCTPRFHFRETSPHSRSGCTPTRTADVEQTGRPAGRPASGSPARDRRTGQPLTREHRPQVGPFFPGGSARGAAPPALWRHLAVLPRSRRPRAEGCPGRQCESRAEPPVNSPRPSFSRAQSQPPSPGGLARRPPRAGTLPGSHKVSAAGQAGSRRGTRQTATLWGALPHPSRPGSPRRDSGLASNRRHRAGRSRPLGAGQGRQ